MTLEWPILTVSIAVITTGVGYFYWCQIRGVLIRQRVFAIRERAWVSAKEGGYLDDSAYKNFRECLNELIIIIPHLSFPILLSIDQSLRLTSGSTSGQKLSSENEAVDIEIKKAIDEVAKEVALYVLFWKPFSAIAFFPLIIWALIISKFRKRIPYFGDVRAARQFATRTNVRIWVEKKALPTSKAWGPAVERAFFFPS